MSMKDTDIKIPILENEYYFHWKVKMHLHFLDGFYFKCIEKGPYVPMKLVIVINPDGSIVADNFVLKSVSEFTQR